MESSTRNMHWSSLKIFLELFYRPKLVRDFLGVFFSNFDQHKNLERKKHCHYSRKLANVIDCHSQQVVLVNC